MKKIRYLFLALIFVALTALFSGLAISVYWPQLVPMEESRPGQGDISVASTTDESITAAAIQASTYFRCPLDNETATIENSLRRPLAIMIENHPSARPQTGLSKACIVYETVAEGGVTRFMAVFVHNDSKVVGPVRSAREYYVDLARQYDALYAHCGGPATIYGILKNLDIAGLDEMANSDAYWRGRGRPKPHNLYSSTDKLRAKAKDRGYEDQVFYQKPNFKDDEPVESRPESSTIEIKFSRPTFAVRYEYDKKSNRYKRFMAKKPHIDAIDDQQIAPKNVVIQYNPIASVANDPKGRMQVNLIGMGNAIVFQDGKVIPATWQRPMVSDLTRFFDAAGAEIKFNTGQTWIEIVDPVSMSVDYR